MDEDDGLVLMLEEEGGLGDDFLRGYEEMEVAVHFLTGGELGGMGEDAQFCSGHHAMDDVSQS